nr:type II toxin-antitoxin system VapC family toxin [Halomonas sp. PR-M31]
MNLLLDTHILLQAAGEPQRLSIEALELMKAHDNILYFSAASIWEIVIKNGSQLPDFNVDAHLLRRGLIENGYRELPITTQHTLGVAHLPPIHRDPFDRILVAQAEFEGFLLLKMDDLVGQYPGPIRQV